MHNRFANQSVTIDDETGEVVQVGGPDFEFGAASGHMPGARFQPREFIGNLLGVGSSAGAATDTSPGASPEGPDLPEIELP
jgi:hypothetical protein